MRLPWAKEPPPDPRRPQLSNTLAKVSQQLAVVVAELERVAERRMGSSDE